MSEESIIEFELSRNEAWDKYTSARPKEVFDRNAMRFFEAGFRMACDSQDEAVRKALDKVNDAFSHLHGEEKITVGEVWDVVNNLKSQIGG